MKINFVSRKIIIWFALLSIFSIFIILICFFYLKQKENNRLALEKQEQFFEENNVNPYNNQEMNLWNKIQTSPEIDKLTYNIIDTGAKKLNRMLNKTKEKIEQKNEMSRNTLSNKIPYQSDKNNRLVKRLTY
ncbi:MAG: hypothetical protein Q8888_00395 [Vigna little leaf phytoplasma]|nr:hypothetical protein [Vigna little leaf phytoplasma]